MWNGSIENLATDNVQLYSLCTANIDGAVDSVAGMSLGRLMEYFKEPTEVYPTELRQSN